MPREIKRGDDHDGRPFPRCGPHDLGPHGGELIGLGKADFHGELLHNDRQVELDVLDSGATELVAIPAKSVTLSLKHQGAMKVFELPADPAATGEATARFVSSDVQLIGWLQTDPEGVAVFMIDGKSFTGKIVHVHAH